MSWEVWGMKSARSYFDAGVFLKTVRRFWPVWGLYGFVWLLALPLSLIGQFNRYGLNLSADVLQTVELTACWLCPVAACAAAMAGFSHLYNERAANFYASLPVRREGCSSPARRRGCSRSWRSTRQSRS